MKKTILLFLLFSLVSTKGMAKGGGITTTQVIALPAV
jgi:hypothetical protein